MTSPILKVCLIDMNNGVANQATRCFRRIVDQFQTRVMAANPDLDFVYQHVQPRNLGQLPDADVDLVLSSGGPGSPFDGFEEPWCAGYRKFLDRVVETNIKAPLLAPVVLAVCHSFELAIIHFQVARMAVRPAGRKFGLMPVYMTPAGRDSRLLAPFGDRLFAFEHRLWEATDLDAARLNTLGGRLLARESRDGRSDKGEALLAFEFAPGVEGTQFHPEADLTGIQAWVNNPEHAHELKETYGEALYQKMIGTLDDPMGAARTFSMLIPGWLHQEFNRIAPGRGFTPIAELDPSMARSPLGFAETVA